MTRPRYAPLTLFAFFLASCGASQSGGDGDDLPEEGTPAEEVDAMANDAAQQMGCPRDQLQMQENSDTLWTITGCDKTMTYEEECQGEDCAWYSSDVATEADRCVEPGAEATESEQALASGTGDSVEVEPGEPCQMEVPAAQARQEAPEAPPETPVEEERTTPPEPDYVWVGGYYHWSGARYVWVGGYWVAPNPGHVYVAGGWAAAGAVWVYTPGGWATVGTTVIVAPPPPRAAVVIWVRPVPRVWVVRRGVRVVVRPGRVWVRRRHVRRRSVHRHRHRHHARNRTRNRNRNRSRARNQNRNRSMSSMSSMSRQSMSNRSRGNSGRRRGGGRRR